MFSMAIWWWFLRAVGGTPLSTMAVMSAKQAGVFADNTKPRLARSRSLDPFVEHYRQITTEL